MSKVSKWIPVRNISDSRIAKLEEQLSTEHKKFVKLKLFMLFTLILYPVYTQQYSQDL